MADALAADAASLTDRGRLAVGLRADIVLVRSPAGWPPSVAAHVIGGHLAFAAKGAPRFLAESKAVALDAL